ncbi:MAG TPA: branched-chain-amino-acid transaminase [Acidobacteriota bacterium]
MGLSVFVNGQYFERREDAVISVFDHGFLYGDGVFEGIRGYGGKIFRLQQHLKRFYDSAKAVMLEVPYSLQDLAEILLECCRRTGSKDLYIRLVISRGAGDLGIDPRKCKTPTVVVIADKIALFPVELYESGIRMTIASVRRTAPDALNPQVKSLNYLNPILAKLEAIGGGFQEAVLLDRNGYVAEGCAENIMLWDGATLKTPAVHHGILEGITRNAILELARDGGIPTSECSLTSHDLFRAEEVFLTGTGCELMPVVEIDGRTIGEGKPGDLLRDLRARFRELTKREGTPFRA